MTVRQRFEDAERRIRIRITVRALALQLLDEIAELRGWDRAEALDNALASFVAREIDWIRRGQRIARRKAEDAAEHERALERAAERRAQREHEAFSGDRPRPVTVEALTHLAADIDSAQREAAKTPPPARGRQGRMTEG